MLWFDIFIQIFAPLILCFLALPILERSSRFKSLPGTDRFLISVVASLIGILFPLYFVGIIVKTFFIETSILLLIIGLFSIGTKFPFFIKILISYIKKLRNYSSNKIKLIDFALIVSIIFFILKYTSFLFLKEIVDYDVASHYLPFARDIIQQNLIPLISQGGPITGAEGGGVLFAWIYGISGSLLSENFRILPLVFILITILLIFSITRILLDDNVAKIAVIIFVFMPMLDNTLVWFSFYPDVPFTMLATAALYFLVKYIKTRKLFFCILVGVVLGLSSFMKAQTLWFFPVLLLVFMPSVKNRTLRYSLSILIPFLFLFVIIPLTYGLSLLNSSMAQFLTYLSPEKFFYSLSVVIMSLLIIFINEQSFKTHSFPEISKINLAKIIIIIFICALPFYLIWYLRNYFSLGTLIWYISVTDADFQWAFALLQKVSGSGLSGSFYLSLLLFPLTLPALGTTFISTKILGAIQMNKINAKISPVLIWGTGYIMFSFAYTNLINERFFLPVTPAIAILVAVGISLIARYVKKFENVNVMVAITLLLGAFSLVQSSLIYNLIKGSSSSLFYFFSKTSASIGLPWYILCGQLSISEIGSQTITLLFFSVLVTFMLIISVLLGRWCIENKIPLVIPLVIRRKILKIKKIVMFLVVLIVTIIVLAAPHLYLILDLSGGNLDSFRSQQRNYYGYGNLYSEVYPYLLGNTSKGDSIVTLGIYGTGLAYYLSNVTLFDISAPQNLAILRDDIESNNLSKTILTLRNMSAIFVLLPSNFHQNTPPAISSFLDRLLFSEIELGNNIFSFEFVINGAWKLYRLTEIISVVGPSVNVIEDGVNNSYSTQNLYFNLNNMTALLKLSGHQIYNVTNFPMYYSYEKILPAPLNLSLDSNNWINFTGESNTVYTVYWSNFNGEYKDIVWIDDSFLEGWIPLWGINQPNTNGDIISLSSPENVTWTHLLKETSIDMEDCSRFIVQVTEIKGGVIFAGKIDGDQKYFTHWISSKGVYIFDIDDIGKRNSAVIIYLDKNTTVKIDYIRFAK
jgi:hypothetical protein